jgi:hypothetical protein
MAFHAAWSSARDFHPECSVADKHSWFYPRSSAFIRGQFFSSHVLTVASPFRNTGLRTEPRPSGRGLVAVFHYARMTSRPVAGSPSNSAIRMALCRSSCSITRKGKSQCSRWTTFGGHPSRLLSATKSASAVTTREAVLLGPCPDLFVRSLLQADVSHVGQPWKQG